MFKSIVLALSMFSKIRVGYHEFFNDGGAGAISAFPVVGLICGIFSACVFYAASYFDLYPSVAAILLVLSLFAVCGFLHYDGLMDTADALLSSRDKEQKVAILKDSSVGAFGVLSAVLLLITNYSSFLCLFDKKQSLFIFILAPVLSRALGGIFLYTLKPLSETGIAAFFRTGKKPIHTVILILFIAVSLGLGAWLISVKYLILFLLSALTVSGLAFRAIKDLGGINGDIIGASVVLFETVFYLSAAIIL